MKKLIIFSFFALFGFEMYSQIGVTVNNEMETSIDYKVNRLIVGVTFDPNNNKLGMVMPSIKYEVIQKDYHNIYIGCMINDLDHISGVRVPVGFNYFPFEKKLFGLLFEVYGTYGKEYDYYLPEGYNNRFFIRGTFGLTYRFDKSK